MYRHRQVVSIAWQTIDMKRIDTESVCVSRVDEMAVEFAEAKVYGVDIGTL